MPEVGKLVWDQDGDKLFETGVDRGVLYVMTGSGYNNGVAWNGLTGVTESPDGAEANDQYADNIKYLSLISEENWKGTIKAFTYPLDFNPCMGIALGGKMDGMTLKNTVNFGQQTRRKFGFSWRSKIGNDVLGSDFSYKIHLAYALSATPTEMDHSTTNDSPEAPEMSWEISSVPVLPNRKILVNGGATEKALKAVSHIVIRKTSNNTAMIQALENKLYGTQSTAPTLPKIDDLIYFLSNNGNWPA